MKFQPARPTHSTGIDGLTFVSQEMARACHYAEAVASTNSNVLITGETGTGKELIARFIHRQSERRDRTFVAVNCAAVPEALFESELFGYERGAFTGAITSVEGKLEQARHGTVFLDEIGELSLVSQAKLLRAIETREVVRLGGRRSIALDVRVVAATNRDLESMLAAGAFRPDLYYRINIGRLHLPPLRERRNDIACLLEQFRLDLNSLFKFQVDGYEPEFIERMLGYDWPGNVRELRNLVESIFIGRPGGVVRLSDVPDWFAKKLRIVDDPVAKEVAELLHALDETRWNKTRAAQRLQWSRMTLYRKMAKYEVSTRRGSAASS